MDSNELIPTRRGRLIAPTADSSASTHVVGYPNFNHVADESAVGAINRPLRTHKPASLRVLMVTGIYPTRGKPHSGTFIQSQVDSLIE
ncbi:MAG: hypothetical protein ACYDER_06820, partial [Ktedonobacteraceae bacterium]